MSTYYDKKKLLDESKDVYISDYDKNLDYSYLSDIIDQKRAYKAAESSGNTSAMKAANDRANSIRLQAASYTAGSDGSKYNRVKLPYEQNKPSYRGSYWEDEKDRIYKMISSYGDFNYNVESDPLYEVYKKLYLSLGDDAYERALGENAMRTGGIASTSAISAASLAKNKYNSMLAQKVPELYDKAYSKYLDGLKALYNRLDVADDMDDTKYSRYRDEIKDYNSDRDYYYKKDKDIADNLYTAYSDETDFAYDLSRDAADDAKDAAQTNYQNKKLELDENAKKYSAAVNLAKALYGKTPISQSVISSIISMLK